MVSTAEIERRYAAVRQAMDVHGVDAVVVCGSEYTGFEGAVTYLSGFVIVQRYAFVLGKNGPRRVFDATHRFVAIYCHDQHISQISGSLQIPQVTNMENIEAAIGENDFLTAYERR